jgi:glycosyltransferase involved in cell wall biosynthesis
MLTVEPVDRDGSPSRFRERSGRNHSHRISRVPVLVHDYLLVFRGAERTFQAMCRMFPEAPVRTLLADPALVRREFPGHPIGASKINRLRLRQRSFQALLPVLPAAAERLDVSGHDLVVSSSSAFAHGVRPDPGAVHVCYCHTPFRYAWYATEAGLAQVPRVMRPAIGRVLANVREWDRERAQGPTHYVANGRITQRRIQEFWGREAEVVYPPVDVERFALAEPEEHYLVVGELVRHKEAEVALAAAELAGRDIVVVGGGADEPRLRARYGRRRGVTFAGRVDDAELARLYARAKAVIVPNVEEFGITAVEAQAAGRPVLAARGGGALETVVEEETGFFFARGDATGLAELLRGTRIEELRPARAVANAERFSVGAFQRGLAAQIRAATQEPPVDTAAGLVRTAGGLAAT